MKEFLKKIVIAAAEGAGSAIGTTAGIVVGGVAGVCAGAVVGYKLGEEVAGAAMREKLSDDSAAKKIIDEVVIEMPDIKPKGRRRAAAAA